MQNFASVKLPFYAKLALVLMSLALILFFLREGATIIIPLVFSILLSLLLLPLAQWLQRKGLNKPLAAIIPLILFVGVLVLLFFFLGKQIADFSQDFPLLSQKLTIWAWHTEKWIEQQFHIAPTQQMNYITNASNDLAKMATNIVQHIVMTTGGLLIWTIFVFIFTFFMLTHRSLIKRFLLMVFKENYHDGVNEVLDETRWLVNGYILGLLIEMVIVAFLSSMAFLIFGIKYAIMLGIICGLLNVIPYIGIYTAMAIGSIITLTNNTPIHALYLIIISIIIHFIDANIILPRIVGGRVKMNPLITIIAVICGSMLWGIAGMFLFIPIAAILKIIFSKIPGMEAWALLMGADENEKKAILKK